MKIVLRLLLILTISFATTSCDEEEWSGIKFRPYWFVGDYKNEQILNSTLNLKVKASSPDFNNYACLNVDQIMELADILRRIKSSR